jgi:hypothetical protein
MNEQQESRLDRVIEGKEPYIWYQPTVDAMVRDFTSIGVKPESAVRGRIMGLLTAQREMLLAKMQEYKSAYAEIEIKNEDFDRGFENAIEAIRRTL